MNLDAGFPRRFPPRCSCQFFGGAKIGETGILAGSAGMPLPSNAGPKKRERENLGPARFSESRRTRDTKCKTSRLRTNSEECFQTLPHAQTWKCSLAANTQCGEAQSKCHLSQTQRREARGTSGPRRGGGASLSGEGRGKGGTNKPPSSQFSEAGTALSLNSTKSNLKKKKGDGRGKPERKSTCDENLKGVLKTRPPTHEILILGSEVKKCLKTGKGNVGRDEGGTLVSHRVGAGVLLRVAATGNSLQTVPGIYIRDLERSLRTTAAQASLRALCPGSQVAAASLW